MKSSIRVSSRLNPNPEVEPDAIGMWRQASLPAVEPGFQPGGQKLAPNQAVGHVAGHGWLCPLFRAAGCRPPCQAGRHDATWARPLLPLQVRNSGLTQARTSLSAFLPRPGQGGGETAVLEIRDGPGPSLICFWQGSPLLIIRIMGEDPTGQPVPPVLR